jgi:hypothetical protein
LIGGLQTNNVTPNIFSFPPSFKLTLKSGSRFFGLIDLQTALRFAVDTAIQQAVLNFNGAIEI